ncbi:hypothetical protein HYDPIDRAFT_29014 [Hydnomerulius pinastri MD-312]|uniref:Uncharacterized protein n=1 Tax=Hydnomerulius pinastri MD-312 TaxID=994086 RepID=A0A0C9W075_9AGAM|nr:hypothetical protein HYDPIDRAFT_29014 [Hydnomerulius pinastri MD-312]
MFSTLKSVFTKSSQYGYAKVARLTPNVSTVHALAISNDGEILASGGADGVKLWNITSHKEIPSNTTHNACGAVSCITWIKTKHSTAEMLCYGTGLGYLVFLRPNPVDKHFPEICARRLGSGFEVTCVAWDASWLDGGSRIVLQSVFAGRLNSTVPKSICYADHGNLYIFGLYDGNVVKMSIAEGTILSEHHCESVIGYAAVSLKKGLVIVDNATNGFTLYRLDTAGPIRTFITNLPTVPVPKQVAFGEESKIIVGGSDNGSVYLFDWRLGKLLETLQHANSGLVRDVGAHCLIASASPTIGKTKAVINVWVHEYDSRKIPTSNNQWTVMSILRAMLVLIALAVLGCIGVGFCTGPLVNTLTMWAAHLPQFSPSEWCTKFAACPTIPVVSIEQLQTAPVGSAAVGGDLGGTTGSKNDLEVLRELAQHIMDLAREAHLETGEYSRKEEEAKLKSEGVSEMGVIYL